MAVRGEGPAAGLSRTGPARSRDDLRSAGCSRTGHARMAMRRRAARRAGSGRVRVAGRAAPGVPVRPRSRLAAGRRAGRPRRGAVGQGFGPAPEDAQGHPGRLDELPAAPYRSSGRLASTRPNTSSISGGSSGRSTDGMAGVSSTCAQMIAASRSFSNGTRPVRHSYSTQPSEYWSARPSTDMPRICSGAT